MTSSSSLVQTETKSKKGGFRRKLEKIGLRKEKQNDNVLLEIEQPVLAQEGSSSTSTSTSTSTQPRPESRGGGRSSDRKPRERRRSHSPSPKQHPPSDNDNDDNASTNTSKSGTRKRAEGFVKRMRSLSRSRSVSSRNRQPKETAARQEQIVTVTSCRSDGYYNQKAPGSTSKLPRKAPSNLKLFHELAVGIKDAYAAVGQTPVKPLEETEGGPAQSTQEYYGRAVLWEFIGNIDFLLALVDEVAVDTATRGALKDDTTFKGLRDVIKKCNKVLEDMLVRRERRYTLFFRLHDPTDIKEVERIKAWNDKVEKAVGAVTESQSETEESGTDTESDASSINPSDASVSSSSGKGSVFSRGRQLLPVAGRVRARRATPTPTLRTRRAAKTKGDESSDSNGSAADDGFAVSTPAVTQGNLAALQEALNVSNNIHNKQKGGMPNGLVGVPKSNNNSRQAELEAQNQIKPKDELVDVIRGLRLEKMKNREGTAENDLVELKPDWRPKADIPSATPKLPIEYIHRHRLMKQVVSSMLDQQEGGTPGDMQVTPIITAITSRHGDKAGNGKTILAVAAIQTVEVRERFSDGIAWIVLGRGPLSERDIRRLYEELYRQLIIKGNADLDDDSDDDGSNSGMDKRDEAPSHGSSFESSTETSNGKSNKAANNNAQDQKARLVALVESRRRFQSGDIEGIKEELGRLLSTRKVLICLDDVWKVEDAKWFIFDNQLLNGTKPLRKVKNSVEAYPSRVLLTTRTPNLLGPGLVNEVFVRILSEHEAVKLMLSTAGRRPYGGKTSAVFNQAKLIVKGCGNSPLAVRLAGSMLRHSNRSWNISSPAWSSLIHQCRLNLEEASQLRSFVNAVIRVVDLSFFTVQDVRTRVALRRCFVAFAMAFRDNDWVLSGKGIPQSVVLRVFRTIISSDPNSKEISEKLILSMLEKLNLIERARHGCQTRPSFRDTKDESESEWDDENEPTINSGNQQMFVMHDSLKAVAEEMAERAMPTLSPDLDDFTSYSEKIEEERTISRESGSLWSAPLRFLAQQLAVGGTNSSQPGFHSDEAHKLVVTSLLNIGGIGVKAGSVAESLRAGQPDIAVTAGGDRMEEYIAAFLPSHLMQCNAFTSAAEVLSDSQYIGRRVHALGIVEATSRHVADLQELRRVAGNITITIPGKIQSPQNSSGEGVSPGGQLDGADDNQTPAPMDVKFDVNGVVRDGSRIIIDEVYRVANKSEGSSDSLGMAMCLAAVGDGLLKARQPRDAMLRLEEAVGIYRNLLGGFHTNVADALHSVAKALVKLGETRVALLKFAEAARIYEACNATLRYNSIANAQSLASLLVDLGDMDKAQSMYEEVISMRKIVHGEHCVPVAKTINAYAILLAKHGRMQLALKNYEASKETYDAVPPQLVSDPEFDIKCKYDVTLINLNIASIRSKKGDLKQAIVCYEDGVRGLREYEFAQAELQKQMKSPDAGKNTAHKHLVAALGRIGSLKLKIADNNGALDAYMSLLREVKEDSPSTSQTEKAKAHIKCATIYRQQDSGADSHDQSIAHLREALSMYTAIFGPDHKDTSAIASSLRQWLSEDQKD